jgi:hypothetical protein
MRIIKIAGLVGALVLGWQTAYATCDNDQCQMNCAGYNFTQGNCMQGTAPNAECQCVCAVSEGCTIPNNVVIPLSAISSSPAS